MARTPQLFEVATRCSTICRSSLSNKLADVYITTLEEIATDSLTKMRHNYDTFG